jgi:hypothetical protein
VPKNGGLVSALAIANYNNYGPNFGTIIAIIIAIIFINIMARRTSGWHTCLGALDSVPRLCK